MYDFKLSIYARVIEFVLTSVHTPCYSYRQWQLGNPIHASPLLWSLPSAVGRKSKHHPPEWCRVDQTKGRWNLKQEEGQWIIWTVLGPLKTSVGHRAARQKTVSLSLKNIRRSCLEYLWIIHECTKGMLDLTSSWDTEDWRCRHGNGLTGYVTWIARPRYIR